VDVRIGLVYTPQPLELELPDDADVDALKAQLTGALDDGAKLVWLTDKKGSQVAIVAERVTYVAIGSGADRGRIGFGA
jgi:hypothetical protein